MWKPFLIILTTCVLPGLCTAFRTYEDVFLWFVLSRVYALSHNKMHVLSEIHCNIWWYFGIPGNCLISSGSCWIHFMNSNFCSITNRWYSENMSTVLMLANFLRSVGVFRHNQYSVCLQHISAFGAGCCDPITGAEGRQINHCPGTKQALTMKSQKCHILNISFSYE